MSALKQIIRKQLRNTHTLRQGCGVNAVHGCLNWWRLSLRPCALRVGGHVYPFLSLPQEDSNEIHLWSLSPMSQSEFGSKEDPEV